MDNNEGRSATKASRGRTSVLELINPLSFTTTQEPHEFRLAQKDSDLKR